MSIVVFSTKAARSPGHAALGVLSYLRLPYNSAHWQHGAARPRVPHGTKTSATTPERTKKDVERKEKNEEQFWFRLNAQRRVSTARLVGWLFSTAPWNREVTEQHERLVKRGEDGLADGLGKTAVT